MRRYGSQAQGGAQKDAVSSHLVHVVFHRGKALRRRVSTSVHLVSQLLHQHFQLVKLGVAGCKVAKQWRLVSKPNWIGGQSRGRTVDGFQ
jgi:hypothetical protein